MRRKNWNNHTLIKCPFNKVVYRRPVNVPTDKQIAAVIGFDTETYADGKPFMFCTSAGETYRPADIPRKLFTRKYRNANFGVWNLKFDSGSILHNVPPEVRTDLREKTRAKYKGMHYTYIPHKLLRIRKGKNAVSFWDINTFFHMSLDAAARKYIGDRKHDIHTKKFTRAYVKKNYNRIKEYCIQDALLVSKLYDYFYIGLDKLGIHPKNLYSPASISMHYFTLKTDIVDVWRYWQYFRGLLEYACESYTGGMFEIYRRGRFNGISYDINSAYPYEIANLLDLTGAIVFESTGYEPGADYGFLRVYVENPAGLHIPCAVKYGPVNIYPAGSFNCTVTKQEYDYIVSIGLKVKIYSAWWIYCKGKVKPYKKVVKDLYAKKQSFKKTDPRMYMIVKLMLNGYYGKMIQLIEHPDGKYYAGGGFNPIHAAVITANTRIKLCDICNRYPDKVYAVHTDSIIMTDTLPGKYLGNNIGQWSYEGEGDGVLIACGIYQIGDKNRFRGMEFTKDFTWTDLLKRSGGQYILSVPHTLAVSWVHANFRHNDKLTNVFLKECKQIKLNADRKRAWPSDMTARQLYKGAQQSFPIIWTDGERGRV